MVSNEVSQSFLLTRADTFTPTFYILTWQHLHHIFFFFGRKGNHATGRGRRGRKPSIWLEPKRPVGGEERPELERPRRSPVKPDPSKSLWSSQASSAVPSVFGSLPLVLFTIFDRFIGRKPPLNDCTLSSSRGNSISWRPRFMKWMSLVRITLLCGHVKKKWLYFINFPSFAVCRGARPP
jgi:hypothetical protein